LERGAGLKKTATKFSFNFSKAKRGGKGTGVGLRERNGTSQTVEPASARKKVLNFRDVPTRDVRVLAVKPEKLPFPRPPSPEGKKDMQGITVSEVPELTLKKKGGKPLMARFNKDRTVLFWGTLCATYLPSATGWRG